MFAVATKRHPEIAACRSIRLINMGESCVLRIILPDVILLTFSVSIFLERAKFLCQVLSKSILSQCVSLSSP